MMPVRHRVAFLPFLSLDLMRSFIDTERRTWTVAVTVDTVKRVRAQCDGLDLLAITSEKDGLMGRLMSDPILLADVLYAVCRPEADRLGVTSEQFGQALAGDAIEHGTTALLESIADFFPTARRTLLRQAIGKGQEIQTKATARASTLLSEINVDALLMKIEQQRETTGSEPATSSPESSASTPAP